MRCIPIFLLALLAAKTCFARDWAFLYKEDDIEVSSNQGSPPTFRAEGSLDVDIADILAVFADIPRRAEWVRNLSESRAIFDNHEDLVLVYSRYNLPWPAADRDSVIESKIAKDYQKKELTIHFRVVESPEAPLVDSVIRVPKADGVLFLKILEPGKTFVRYEITLDPGGWLPQWICNFFTRDAPIKMLKAMKVRVVEKKDFYKDFTENQRRLWFKNH